MKHKHMVKRNMDRNYVSNLLKSNLRRGLAQLEIDNKRVRSLDNIFPDRDN